MGWLAALQAFLAISAQLPTIVHSVEQAFGGQGSGADKKQVVMDIATNGLTAAQAAGAKVTPDQIGAITTSVSAVTDAVVASFNAAKVFKKNGAPAS